MKVQSLERTLIDKVFALGDYYLSNATLRTSRHIYDISRLLTKADLSAPAMKELAVSVRNDRKANKTCLSAQDAFADFDCPRSAFYRYVLGEFKS